MSVFSKLVDTVCESLNAHPEKWSFDDYRATHADGRVSVWIANGHFALSIESGFGTFGGVTAWSSFFGWLTPWRRRVLNAVQAAAVRRAVKALT